MWQYIFLFGWDYRKFTSTLSIWLMVASSESIDIGAVNFVAISFNTKYHLQMTFHWVKLYGALVMHLLRQMLETIDDQLFRCGSIMSLAECCWSGQRDSIVHMQSKIMTAVSSLRYISCFVVKFRVTLRNQTHIKPRDVIYHPYGYLPELKIGHGLMITPNSMTIYWRQWFIPAKITNDNQW